jgi:hypothetical protein
MIKIDGVQVEIIKRNHKGDKRVKGTIIVPKTTATSIRNKGSTADILSYEAVREYVEKHRKTLMKNKNNKYQISVFTMQGWRSPREHQNFGYDGDIQWYDVEKEYGKAVKDQDDIFGVYILDLGPK